MYNKLCVRTILTQRWKHFLSNVFLKFVLLPKRISFFWGGGDLIQFPVDPPMILQIISNVDIPNFWGIISFLIKMQTTTEIYVWNCSAYI